VPGQFNTPVIRIAGLDVAVPSRPSGRRRMRHDGNYLAGFLVRIERDSTLPVMPIRIERRRGAEPAGPILGQVPGVLEGAAVHTGPYDSAVTGQVPRVNGHRLGPDPSNDVGLELLGQGHGVHQ